MGTVCSHQESETANAVEVLADSISADSVEVPRRMKSDIIQQPGGDDQVDLESGESAEEQSDRCSTLSAFATISFGDSTSAQDPNEISRLMKQRSRELEQSHECPSLKQMLSRASSTLSGKPDFTGVWRCIDTWNLDNFLQACGVNKLQRLAACKAPWPWWSMEHDLDIIYFINHGPLGDIEEFIDLSGKEYVSHDGKKQKMTNKASWEGKTLVIIRDGPVGIFREERTLENEDTLSFRLTIQSGPKPGISWGRTFVRGGEDLVRKSEQRRNTWKAERASLRLPC
jgi:hypothetical protein